MHKAKFNFISNLKVLELNNCNIVPCGIMYIFPTLKNCISIILKNIEVIYIEYFTISIAYMNKLNSIIFKNINNRCIIDYFVNLNHISLKKNRFFEYR